MPLYILVESKIANVAHYRRVNGQELMLTAVAASRAGPSTA